MSVTLISAGLLATLLFLLSAYVIAGRVKLKIDLGDGGNTAMRQRMRAHGNFTEYVPVALILLFLVEKESIGPRWFVVTMGTVLVVARYWALRRRGGGGGCRTGCGGVAAAAVRVSPGGDAAPTIEST